MYRTILGSKFIQLKYNAKNFRYNFGSTPKMYSTFSGFVMDIYSRLWIDMIRLILSELCCQEMCWTLLDNFSLHRRWAICLLSSFCTMEATTICTGLEKEGGELARAVG